MIAGGIILIVAVGIGAATILLNSAPSSARTEENDQLMWGDFLISAEASFSQNLMPIVPEEGPPFSACIYINVTNRGQTTLKFHNFSRIKAIVHYNDTSEELVALEISSSPIVELPLSLEPAESVIICYSDRSRTTFAPDIEEGTYFYAKISFTWDYMNWFTLTTAPSEVEFIW
jgi:hypothetical protein